MYCVFLIKAEVKVYCILLLMLWQGLLSATLNGLGSKMDCRNLRSARVMASWTADDGSIDINAPRRPGIVNFYLVHSVKINGEFFQHAFAVVWWIKTDHDQGHFGKPAQVWKRYDYEPSGPAVFMPVQRIAQRFACCSVKLNGVDKLVVSPIPRLFH